MALDILNETGVPLDRQVFHALLGAAGASDSRSEEVARLGD